MLARPRVAFGPAAGEMRRSREHLFETTNAEFEQITSHFAAPTAKEGYNVARQRWAGSA